MYQPAAGVLLVLGGALSCFAGYRLFRVVLAIYGFILGGSIASSTLAATNATGQVLAWIVGGLAGGVILVLAYFVGIALIGAGLGALVAHVGWTYFGTAADPPAALVIVLAILGAIGAMVLQRYVIVVATAFGGAWTLLLGVAAMLEQQTGAPRSADVWVMYPTTVPADARWLPIAWFVLGVFGTAVQLGITGRKRT